MPNETAAPEKRSDRTWGFLMGWVGRITAIVGLCATLAGGVTWFVNHHRQQLERSAQLALAETQSVQGNYEASVETYGALLKADPLDREVLDRQLNTTMLWAENFSVLVPEGQSATQPAGHALDTMMSILESGMTRSKGTRAADVQAHLGWAHWLNQHIAEREFGSAAEQNLHAALATDSANVYANAMIGNWMLQNHGNFAEAVEHLHTAVDSGKARTWVRRMQLGGLSSYSGQGARAEMVRVANAMRRGGEPLSADEKHRVFDICCNVTVTQPDELNESLTAVAPQDAWETYLWLENAGRDVPSDSLQGLTHDFIQAKLLEISGQTPQALRQFREVQQKLHAYPTAMLNDIVDAAVQKLSHPKPRGGSR